jgi:hypothetical protein
METELVALESATTEAE